MVHEHFLINMRIMTVHAVRRAQEVVIARTEAKSLDTARAWQVYDDLVNERMELFAAWRSRTEALRGKPAACAPLDTMRSDHVALSITHTQDFSLLPPMRRCFELSCYWPLNRCVNWGI